ncbi:MAG: hypothetical protein ACREIS_05605 [Nitrospiraceae bacterium]
MAWDTAAAKEQYRVAVEELADRWVPACGGLESPSDTSHGRYLYVFNPGRALHGWLNLETDIVQMESPYRWPR